MCNNKIYIITILFVLSYLNSLSKTLIISCDSIDYSVSILEYLNISKEKAKEIDTIQLLKYDYNALPISAVDFPNLKELKIKFYDIYDLKGISDFKKLTSLVIEDQYQYGENIFKISEIFNIRSLKNLELPYYPNLDLKYNTLDSLLTFKIKYQDMPIYNLLYFQKKNKTIITLGSDGDNFSRLEIPTFLSYLLCQKASIIVTKPIDSLSDRMQVLKEQFNKTAIPKTGFYELKTDSIHINGYFKNGLMDSIWNFVYKYPDESEAKSIYQYKNGNCIYYNDSMMYFVRLKYFNNNTYYDIRKEYEYNYRYEIDSNSRVGHYVETYRYNKEKDILLYETVNDEKWIIDFKNHIAYKFDENKSLLFFFYGNFVGCNKQLNECFTNNPIYPGHSILKIKNILYHNSFVMEESELCRECLNRYDELRKTNYEDEFKEMIESIKF